MESFLLNTTHAEDVRPFNDSTLSTSQQDNETTAKTPDRSLDSLPLYQASQWIWKVSPPVILALGTFGNVMAIMILSRMRSGWSAMNLYLRALAASDLCVLYTGLAVNWVDLALGFDVRATHGIVCKLRVWILNSCAVFSAWLLVVFTLHRAASIVWPHRVNVVCTRRKSLTAISCTFLVVCLLYSHLLYGFDVVSTETSWFCSMGFQSYKTFIDDVWVEFDMFFFSLLPFAFLVLSNGVLVFRLAQSVKAARETLTTGQQIDDRQKRASATTVTLIVVSTAFVVLTLPITVKNILFSLYTSDFTHSHKPQYIAVRSFFDSLAYMLFYWNYAINFYVYCLTGTRFRREFEKIVCCWRKKRPSVSKSRMSGTTIVSATVQYKPKDDSVGEDEDF